MPPILSVDSSTGVIAGTPRDLDEGTYSSRVTASDGTASTSDQYSLTVVAIDDPPVLPYPPPPLGTAEDTPLEITPQLLEARDEDPSSLTVVLTPPSGDADFALSNGGRVVVPDRDFNGTLNVEASVKDASSTSNRVTLTITVTPVNDAPRFERLPAQSASEGVPFELPLRDLVSDPEGDSISFSATGLPQGLAIDPASGTIAGTPAIDAAAGTHTARITAADAESSSSASLELRVTAAGRADLSVTAAVSPNPALSGSTATFTFDVTISSSADVGNASLAVAFIGDAPFTIDAVSDPACTIEPAADSVAVSCAFAPLTAGASRSIDVTGSAEQAAEIRADALVAITDAVPIDDMADNDDAVATLVVARSLGGGAAQELAAPGATAVAVADIDGDGVEDIVTTAGAGQPLLVFLNRAASDDPERLALDATPLAVGDALDAVDVAAADVDGDGD